MSVLLYTVLQFDGSSEPPLSQEDYWGKIPMALLLACVSHVQVTGGTCSRNLAAKLFELHDSMQNRLFLWILPILPADLNGGASS